MATATSTPAPGPGSVPPPVADRSVDLFGPTARPDEPLTAGAVPLIGGTPDTAVIEQLRALYSRFPSEDLREVLEDAEAGGF